MATEYYRRHEKYTFHAKNVQDGGILIPFHPGEYQYIKEPLRKQWESLLDQNAKTWRKYSLSQTFTMDELILVTGFVKTHWWIVAAIQGSGEFELEIYGYKGLSVRLNSDSPKFQGTAQCWLGDLVDPEVMDRLRLEMLGPEYTIERKYNDQCVIVEGRRFAKRDWRRLQELKAAAEPEEPAYDRDRSQSSAVLANSTVPQGAPTTGSNDVSLCSTVTP